MRANPMWLKAPFLLFRWPPILAAIGIGIVVLVVSIAVAPLFLSSAAGGALREELRDLPPTSAGLVIGQATPFTTLRFPRADGGTIAFTPAELHERRGDTLDAVTQNLAHLGPSRATVSTGESIVSANGEQLEVQPLAREGFESNIDVLSSVDGHGVWLARSAADTLGVAAGDMVDIEIDGTAKVRIKGIYSDLAEVPVTPFWLPADGFIHAPTPAAAIPPPPLLMDVATLLGLGQSTQSVGVEVWEFPLEPAGLTLDQGRELSAQLSVISRRALDRESELGALFNEPFMDTTLPVVVDAAADTVTGVQSPVQVLALIGSLVALVLITISAHYVVEKRTIEFRLLVARGVGTGWLTMRSIAESVLAALVFGSLGAAATVGLVEIFGPGPIDAGAVRQAALLAAGALLLALTTFGLATAAAATKKTAVEQRPTSHDTGVPWEIVLLVAAGVALYLIDRRGAIAMNERNVGRVDILLVLFPLLGISGGALFLLRFGFSYLNRARAATANAGTPLFLAARRLASASRSVMLFVGAAAVSVGMLVYSTGLVSSVRATTYAKTHVFVGSDVAVVVGGPESLDIPFEHTFVSKLDGDVGERPIEVMGIDPASFTDTAYWDDDFADSSLQQLVGSLDQTPTESLPVLVAGDASLKPSSFSVAGHDAPVEVVGRAETWPGMRKNTPMFVADQELLTSAAAKAGFSIASAESRLWVKGPTNDVLRSLQEAGVDTQAAVSARDAARSSALLSISWTFGLLRLLGIVAGSMAVVGMLLYVASRHRTRLVAYLLGRRMGLRASTHRTALLLELLAMLTAALLLGGSLGLGATRLIFVSLDLLPTVPPTPLFRIPALEMGAAAVVFVAAAVAGARLIQRASDRARAGEVMRLAD